MTNYTESYIDRPYHSVFSTITTYLLCSALSHGINMPSEESIDKDLKLQTYNSISQYRDILDEHCVVPSPTWSAAIESISRMDIGNEFDYTIDTARTLSIINELSFMQVDEEIDQKIEKYFISKPVKTRTVLENHRIKKG